MEDDRFSNQASEDMYADADSSHCHDSKSGARASGDTYGAQQQHRRGPAEPSKLRQSTGRSGGQLTVVPPSGQPTGGEASARPQLRPRCTGVGGPPASLIALCGRPPVSLCTLLLAASPPSGATFACALVLLSLLLFLCFRCARWHIHTLSRLSRFSPFQVGLACLNSVSARAVTL